jgi:hypothetical protein
MAGAGPVGPRSVFGPVGPYVFNDLGFQHQIEVGFPSTQAEERQDDSDYDDKSDQVNDTVHGVVSSIVEIEPDSLAHCSRFGAFEAAA